MSFHHFYHRHGLFHLNNNEGYLCDGCKTPGYGNRYRCHSCDFDLHHICAHSPRTLNFFMHPYPMTLLLPNPGWRLICNVCNEPIHGLFYGCNNFNAHPICAHLPRTIHGAPAHSAHPLEAMFDCQRSMVCDTCRGKCVGWRYQCINGACNANFHLECLGGKMDSKLSRSSTNRSALHGSSGGGGRMRKRDAIFALLNAANTGLTMYEIYNFLQDVIGLVVGL